MAAARNNDLSTWFVHGIDLKSRSIYLGGTGASDESGAINHQTAEQALKGIFTLGQMSDQPITLILNSIGGDVDSGMAIYDAIKTCECPVVAMVYGAAYSMAAILLQAADDRVMMPSSSLMIHYGLAGREASPHEVYSFGREMRRLAGVDEEIFLARIRERHPRYPKTKVQELLKNGAYLTAKEAVELGLADRVFGE